MIRRLLLRTLILVVLLAGGVAAWLLWTEPGARSVVSRLRDALPGLEVGAVEGRVGGVVTLRDVRWSGDGTSVTVARLSLVPRVLTIARGNYRFERVEAEGVRVRTDTVAANADAAPLNLPSIGADALAVRDAAWTDGATVVALDRLAGAIAIGGAQLRITGLDAASAGQRVAGDLVLDLAAGLPTSARLRFDWLLDAMRYAGTLEAATQRGATSATLTLAAPVAGRLELATHAASPWRAWTAKLELPAQQVAGLPAPWGDAPLALALDARGSREQVALSGRIESIGRAWVLESATLRALAQGWRVDDARLAEVDGPGAIELAGTLGGDDGQLAVTATFIDFAMPLPGDIAATRASGSLGLAGTPDALGIVPDLTVNAPGLPPGRLTGRAHLTAETLEAAPIELQVGDGALAIVGPIPRADDADGAVAVVARAFDPALLAAAWPGRIDGAVAFRGRGLLGSAPSGTLQIQTLTGRLRGHAFAADGRIEIDGGAIGATVLTVRSGSASLQVDGRVDDASGLAIALDAPDLAALLPDARGALEVRIDLPGPLGFAAVESGAVLPRRIDANATGVAYAGLGIDAATLTFEAANGADGPMRLALEAGAVRMAGVVADRLALRGDGSPQTHALTLDVQRGELGFALGADGSWSESRWSGTLGSARLQLPGVLDAALRAPASLEIDADTVALGEICLDGAQGNACFSAGGSSAEGSAALTLSAVPLALAGAFVEIPADVELEGRVDGDGELRWAAGTPGEGRIALRSERGVWRDPALPEVDLGYERLSLDANWSGGRGDATLDAALLPDGSLHATTVPDGDPGASAWRTDIALTMPRLDWVEEFVPQFDQVGGRAEANMALRNWPAAPRLEGLVRIGGFAADVPTLGIRVYDGDIVLVQREGGLDVAGTVRSGDGRLALTGRLDRDAELPVDLRLRGNEVLVVDRGDARVVAAPDLTIVYDQKMLRVGGAIVVPSARFDLARLEAGAERSSDVVVVDDPKTAAGPAANWRAKVAVTLGDDVKLNGLGLVGRVSGTVTVSQRARRAATGTGELSVTGRYAALGQAFEIERGRVLFSGGPLDNPSLLLIAEQRLGERTTRVRIVGTARRPELNVSSPQATTQSEAIANLMGRSGAFSFGRYLSPKLYVGYGIGLVSGGEIFTVRYRIGRGIELEANSGAENNAAINYRIER